MRELNLIEKLQVTDAKEYYFAMDNELFNTLLEMKEENVIKSTHIPFVYSYLFITGYMYKYGKYNNYMMKTSDVKELLGFAHNNKAIDYLIKKNGVLDSYDLTETTTDITVGYELDELGSVNLITLSQFPSDIIAQFRVEYGITNRQTIKIPKSYDFDHIENTTLCDIRVFEFCMRNDELGINAFYLYSYLKHMNFKFKGYDANHIRLAKELGLSKNTIQKYRDAMRKYNMIYLSHNMEVFHPNMKDAKVSTNYINKFEQFSNVGMEYNKFLKSSEKDGNKFNLDLSKRIVAEKIKVNSFKVEIALEDLPF